MSVSPSEFWKSRLAIPAYRVGEAASYAHISPQTVAAWHKSTRSDASAPLGGKEKGAGLSFLQLIEIAVVAEMRRAGLKLSEIARARKYLTKSFDLEFPFAQMRFKTDGVEVLLDRDTPLDQDDVEKLISANYGGQLVWRDFLAERLKEFNYDDSGAVSVWHVAGRQKPITIDPKIAFGAPQVSGVRTAIIRDRWLSGSEVDDIADDFGVSESEAIEALLFEGIQRENSRLAKWIN